MYYKIKRYTKALSIFRVLFVYSSYFGINSIFISIFIPSANRSNNFTEGFAFARSILLMSD